MKKNILILGCLFALCLAFDASASGIFTLKGKLKAFTEDLYIIETQKLVYEIRKSELDPNQQEELRKKKTGSAVELTLATEAVAKVRDL